MLAEIFAKTLDNFTEMVYYKTVNYHRSNVQRRRLSLRAVFIFCRGKINIICFDKFLTIRAKTIIIYYKEMCLRS